MSDTPTPNRSDENGDILERIDGQLLCKPGCRSCDVTRAARAVIVGLREQVTALEAERDEYAEAGRTRWENITDPFNAWSVGAQAFHLEPAKGNDQ